MAESEGFEPRYGFPYTRFPGVLLQPLGQLSRLNCLDKAIQLFAVVLKTTTRYSITNLRSLVNILVEFFREKGIIAKAHCSDRTERMGSMAYVALYRTWRPQTFEDLVGAGAYQNGPFQRPGIGKNFPCVSVYRAQRVREDQYGPDFGQGPEL